MSATTSLAGRLRTMDRGTRLVGGAAVALVAAALLSFVVAPAATVYPVVLLVGVLAYGWRADREATAMVVVSLATVGTVVILGLITVFLVVQSVPAFAAVGPAILLDTGEPLWQPSAEVYSLVPMMWGTFVTTLLATLVAAPLGVAGALFISEIAPDWARELLKPGVEVLAGIPSIVYGFLGFVVINQYMMDTWGLPSFGSFVVVGGVVGVMALPTVVSVAEDAIDSVPDAMRDGSLALGSTDWQTTKHVTVPAAFSGISAAVLLGVGRAVGETMAATVILANTTAFPEPLYDVFGNTITLTSLIASQFGAASGLQMNALFAAGVVLFVSVMGISLASQYVEARMRERLGGEL